MSRERVIVSIGEALLAERGGQIEAGGLALAYATQAAVAGFRGAAVSRVGQDAAGDQLLGLARERGIDVEHVQTDPDLPTGRLITRALAGRTNSTLTAHAAFDNLQWDFDMVDLAQRAEAVIFGQLARRNGQTKSVIKQFLLECGSGGAALRVFDLTNRAGEALDRAEVATGLEFCEVLVSDERGLSSLVPGSAGDSPRAARELLRSTGVRIVVLCMRKDQSQRLSAFTRDETADASEESPVSAHEATMMRLIASLLDGQPLAASVRVGSRAAS